MNIIIIIIVAYYFHFIQFFTVLIAQHTLMARCSYLYSIHTCTLILWDGFLLLRINYHSLYTNVLRPAYWDVSEWLCCLLCTRSEVQVILSHRIRKLLMRIHIYETQTCRYIWRLTSTGVTVHSTVDSIMLNCLNTFAGSLLLFCLLPTM